MELLDGALTKINFPLAVRSGSACLVKIVLQGDRSFPGFRCALCLLAEALLLAG